MPLLPLSALVARRACDLERRIEDFTAYHGFAPDETSTLRQWTEVTPDIQDLLWATRCLPREQARQLAVGTAFRAVCRVLPIFREKYTEDKRPRQAMALVELWLADPSVSKAEINAAYAAASAAAAAAVVAAAAALERSSPDSHRSAHSTKVGSLYTRRAQRMAICSRCSVVISGFGITLSVLSRVHPTFVPSSTQTSPLQAHKTPLFPKSP